MPDIRQAIEELPQSTPQVMPASSGLHSYTWYVVGLLFVVNIFNYMDRMALAMLMPFIKADLQLSDAQLGLLVGLAFAVFYAVCGIPIARLADRGVRRNVIAVCLTVWSAATALSGAAQNFWHLFLARVGVGAGEAGCIPPAQSIICDYIPPRKRPGVFAFHHFGLIVGSMMGLAVAGALGEAFGYRGRATRIQVLMRSSCASDTRLEGRECGRRGEAAPSRPVD